MNWQHMILTVEYGTLARWAVIVYLLVILIGIRGGMALERWLRPRPKKNAPSAEATATESRPN